VKYQTAIATAIAGLLLAAMFAVADHTPTRTSVVQERAVRSTSAPTTAASTTTSIARATPPPPPRVLATTSFGPTATDIAVVSPEGGPTETRQGPGLPLRQISMNAGLEVYSKTLNSASRPFSGCGVAGCSSGYNTTTESGIAIANISGANEQLITSGGYDVDPTFSPDGHHIAFVTHQKGPSDTVFDAIAVVDIHGAPAKLLDPPPRMSYSSPTWSPDGQAVAVRETPGEGPLDDADPGTVLILPIDGSAPKRLVNGGYRELAWSHDGRFLASVVTQYMHYGTRTHWQPGDHPTGDDIYLIPVAGGTPRRLTHIAPTQEVNGAFCGAFGGVLIQASYPTWSPDDTKIAFLTNADHVDELGHFLDVAVVNSDGSHMRTVLRAEPAHCDGKDRPFALLGWG
jgi:dipeptidyl aminopeptidase/acylaminoacyl peptidase